MEHFPNTSSSVVVAKYFYFDDWHNFFASSLFPNPDLEEQIYDCLLTSMAALQAEDVRSSFLCVGELNGHYQERQGSRIKNRHEVATFDFATLLGCDELIAGLTHARGGTLDHHEE